MVERGRSSRPSVIRLHGAPSAEKISAEDLTLTQDYARLVLQLEKRVATLEARVPLNVTQALVDIEQRLSQLETTVQLKRNGAEQTERTAPDG